MLSLNLFIKPCILSCEILPLSPLFVSDLSTSVRHDNKEKPAETYLTFPSSF